MEREKMLRYICGRPHPASDGEIEEIYWFLLGEEDE